MLPLTARAVAEGVGFEPTVTCATMVFETIRFGRSRIPPGGMLRDRQRSACEERGEQRPALGGPHAGHDLGRVVEARIGREVVEAAGRARLRDRPRRTRAAAHAPPIPRPRTSGTARAVTTSACSSRRHEPGRLGGGSQREQLGVRRRIAAQLALVVRAGDDRARSADARRPRPPERRRARRRRRASASAACHPAVGPCRRRRLIDAARHRRGLRRAARSPARRAAAGSRPSPRPRPTP